MNNGHIFFKPRKLIPEITSGLKDRKAIFPTYKILRSATRKTFNLKMFFFFVVANPVLMCG